MSSHAIDTADHDTALSMDALTGQSVRDTTARHAAPYAAQHYGTRRWVPVSHIARHALHDPYSGTVSLLPLRDARVVWNHEPYVWVKGEGPRLVPYC